MPSSASPRSSLPLRSARRQSLAGLLHRWKAVLLFCPLFARSSTWLPSFARRTCPRAFSRLEGAEILPTLLSWGIRGQSLGHVGRLEGGGILPASLFASREMSLGAPITVEWVLISVPFRRKAEIKQPSSAQKATKTLPHT